MCVCVCYSAADCLWPRNPEGESVVDSEGAAGYTYAARCLWPKVAGWLAGLGPEQNRTEQKRTTTAVNNAEGGHTCIYTDNFR